MGACKREHFNSPGEESAGAHWDSAQVSAESKVSNKDSGRTFRHQYAQTGLLVFEPERVAC